MSRVVIGPHAGGVGDNLIYWSLPELYKKQRGVDEVLIGVGGENPAWRNSQTYDLVWGHNPYVDGYTNDRPDAGAQIAAPNLIAESKRLRSTVAAIERLHGFEPQHRLPQLYYQPKRRRDVRHAILASPTAVSCPMTPKVFDEFAGEIARWYGFHPTDIIVLESDYDGRHGRGSLAENPRIHVADYFEKVDLIASCALFLSTESGDQAIAAAVRDPWTTHVCCSIVTFNDKLWIYDGIEYRSSKYIRDYDGDYHPYPNTNRPAKVWGEVALRF